MLDLSTYFVALCKVTENTRRRFVMKFNTNLNPIRTRSPFRLHRVEQNLSMQPTFCRMVVTSGPTEIYDFFSFVLVIFLHQSVLTRPKNQMYWLAYKNRLTLYPADPWRWRKTEVIIQSIDHRQKKIPTQQRKIRQRELMYYFKFEWITLAHSNYLNGIASIVISNVVVVVVEEHNECNGQWDGRGWQDSMSSKTQWVEKYHVAWHAWGNYVKIRTTAHFSSLTGELCW